MIYHDSSGWFSKLRYLPKRLTTLLKAHIHLPRVAQVNLFVSGELADPLRRAASSAGQSLSKREPAVIHLAGSVAARQSSAARPPMVAESRLP